MHNDNLLNLIIEKLQLKKESLNEVKSIIDSYEKLIETDFNGSDYSKLISTREYTSGFKHRLLFEYSKPIQDMEIFIEHCKGIAETTAKKLESDKSKKAEILLRLQQKSTLLASEIVYLIKGGYPSAAISRWRSLLEVSVVTSFLALHEEEISIRYFEYEIVERKKEMEVYIRNADYLGFEKIPETTQEKINNKYNKIIEKYGKSFSKNFGWSHSILSKERISLNDLMEKTNSHYLQPFYQFANNYVHGGPKSLIYNLGYIDGVSGKNTISRSSNIGFTDPGQLTALCYYNVVFSVFSFNPSIEGILSLLFLYPKITKIGKNFSDVEKSIIDREAQSDFPD